MNPVESARESLRSEPSLPSPHGRKRRVCFSLPFAEQLLTGGSGYFGGAEVRGVAFLRGLARDASLDVHVVVLGPVRAPVVRDDGITVHFRPDVSFYEGQHDDVNHSVWGAVDADLYVAFGANEATAELARFCGAHGSALVLSVASDISFAPFVFEGSRQRDAYGTPGHYIWYGLRHAHAIVVQTERQQAMLLTLVGRDGEVIRNPAPSTIRTTPRTAPQFGGRLLWVGRTDPNKRYEEALALAAALPHRPMIMVCNNIHDANRHRIDELQRALPNLMLADQVALEDMDALFRFSDVLVNTSRVEGSPNTFLQAGMHGIPVVSMTVDPDGVLATHGCGRLADGTPAGLVQTVEALLTDRTAYAVAAAANARWLCDRHDPAARVAELSAVVYRTLSTFPRMRAAQVA